MTRYRRRTRHPNAILWLWAFIGLFMLVSLAVGVALNGQ